MKTSLSVPLMEQEQLQELLQILEDNGMKEEKRQVMGLAQYLDTMDEQLGAVLTELKEVKEQLGEIKDSGIKAAALRVVTRVEGKIQEAKSQVHTLMCNSKILISIALIKHQIIPRNGIISRIYLHLKTSYYT